MNAEVVVFTFYYLVLTVVDYDLMPRAQLIGHSLIIYGRQMEVRQGSNSRHGGRDFKTELPEARLEECYARLFCLGKVLKKRVIVGYGRLSG